MRRYRIFFTLIVCLGLLAMYCGQGGGDNPVGVTGGAEEGYGEDSITEGSAVQGSGDPVGVTGGALDGYGKSSEMEEASGSGSVNPGQTGNLVGTWEATVYGVDASTSMPIEIELTLTVNADGSYEMEQYNSLTGETGTETGNYYLSGDQLYIDGKLNQYILSGNTLTLYEDGQPIYFTRTS